MYNKNNNRRRFPTSPKPTKIDLCEVCQDLRFTPVLVEVLHDRVTGDVRTWYHANHHQPWGRYEETDSGSGNSGI
jgi:hypothetical protein